MRTATGTAPMTNEEVLDELVRLENFHAAGMEALQEKQNELWNAMLTFNKEFEARIGALEVKLGYPRD